LLSDEYYSPQSTGNIGLTDGNGIPYSPENCAKDPYSAYTDSSGKMYGSVGNQGCQYATDYTGVDYFAPSSGSIMDRVSQWNPSSNPKFDIVSCGYLASALNGQALTQTNASTHFAECSNMDVSGKNNIPVVSKAPTIVTVGGFGTGVIPSFSGIFKWVHGILPSSIKTLDIPLSTNSPGYNKIQIMKAIDLSLASGRPVVVVAHSLGAFLAYQVSQYYMNSNVKFIYVDPPYNFILSQFGSLGTTAKVFKNNPSLYVNWTNGNAIGYFANLKTHDAFDFYDAFNPLDPNLTLAKYPTNDANLKSLQSTIYQAINYVSDSAAAYAQVAAGTIGSAPIINGVEDSSGNLINSISPGQTAALTGTFTSGPFDINVTNANDPSIYYSFYAYPSLDGSTISFTLPQYYDLSDSNGQTDIVPGTYLVSVASANSDWSSPISVQLTSTSTASLPTPTGIINVNTLQNQFQMNGSGFSATGNSVGLTPVTTSMNEQTSNTASVWDAFIQFIKSIFGFNKASAQTVATPTYIISGLTSDGSSVQFTVPSNVPNGTYTVSIKSANTGWVTTTYTITVTGNSTGSTGTGTATTTCTTNCRGTTVTTATTTNGTYSCPSGYSISGTSCIKPAITTSATITCASGYSLSGTTCTFPAVTTSVPASTVAATVNYYCTTGGSVMYGSYLDGLGNWQNGPYCNSHGAIGYSTWYGAGISSRTCPSGATGPTYSGSSYICNIPAHTVTTPAITASATVICPSGYSVSGTSCVLPAVTIAATLSCGTGYSVYGNSCNINTTPVGLSASASSQTGINLSWTNLSSTGVSNILIERSVDGSNFTQIRTLSSSDTSFSDIGLSINSTYYYRIRTILVDGSYGVYSLIVSATTSNLSTPTSLIATATSTSTISLSWSDSDTGITSYTITQMSPTSTTFTATAKTYVVTNLLPSTKYCFSVSSNVNTQNSSALSSQACATTLTPIAPLAVSCSPTPSSIVRSNNASVIWNSVVKGGVTPYHYTWSWPTSAGVYGPIGTDSNTYSWGSFGTSYAAGTRVMKLTVTSGSNSITVSCGALVLKAAVPTITASANGPTGLNLSWTDTDTNVNSFVILSSPSSTTVATLGSTTLKYSVTSLLPNTRYCYAVQSTIDAINTATSPVTCATTGSLVAPTSLSSSATSQGQVKLSWNNNGAVGFTGVDIERSTTKNSGYSSIAMATSTSYLDTGLSSLTTYYYNVRLVYPGGLYSSYTSTSTVTTLRSTTPVNTATTTSPTSITPATTTQQTNTVPATVIYTCSTGTLSGTNCVSSNASVGIAPIASYKCPAGYTPISFTQCNSVDTNRLSRHGNTNASSTILLPMYSCNPGYTLNTTNNLCYSSSPTTTTVPATPVYSCTAGYVLNNTTHMCSTIVGTNDSRSSATANVWDAIVNWFGGLF
ncbi:MAG: fibronectin type III domain-containing protein, partial [Candidatus Taylorbacteria bacterium]